MDDNCSKIGFLDGHVSPEGVVERVSAHGALGRKAIASSHADVTRGRSERML